MEIVLLCKKCMKPFVIAVSKDQYDLYQNAKSEEDIKAIGFDEDVEKMILQEKCSNCL